MTLSSNSASLKGLALLMSQQGLLDQDRALECQMYAEKDQIHLIQFLIEHEILKAPIIAGFISQQFGLPYCDLSSIEPESIQVFSSFEPLIRRHHCIPIIKKKNHLLVATYDPSREGAIKEIQLATGLNVQMMIVEYHQLMNFINVILKPSTRSKNTLVDDQLEHIQLGKTQPFVNTEDLEILGGNQTAPIIKFVEKVLQSAINKNASDIHFEPFEHDYRIRFRIDGALIEMTTLPISIMAKINTRIKILSNLDISEKRVPQDGRFDAMKPNGVPIECRVSTCPTTYGEKIVIRLLDSNNQLFDVRTLGLNDEQYQLFIEAIHQPYGLIIVTGPTGSGKSLTLYNALNLLNTKEVNICTVEDPVEIRMNGINQVNVNPKAGLTFALTLRSFLRQDPDIIMVGEIRDLETAEIAISSAQTGHLVLSTLHTNNAASSITRLKNMGIPSYNIASSLVLIIAQRLVRRLCPYCKKIVTHLTQQNLVELGFTEQEAQNASIYHANGCFRCTNGYKGRIALYELLPINSSIESLILSGSSSLEIENHAIAQGMKTIHRSGLDKILEGITTIEEVNRVAVESS